MRNSIISMMLGCLLACCGRPTPLADGDRPLVEDARPSSVVDDTPAVEAVPPPADPSERVTCPVCGLEFDAREARAAAVHGGRTYRFLVEDHADAFRRDPSRYLSADAGRP